jgi:hypothetical protein
MPRPYGKRQGGLHGAERVCRRDDRYDQQSLEEEES